MRLTEFNLTSTSLYSPPTTHLGFISHQLYEFIHRLCGQVVTTIICVVGIFTNIVNCLVFYRQGLRDRMNLCLFSLALIDLYLLLCIFATFSVSSFIEQLDESVGEEYLIRVTAGMSGIIYAFRAASGLITALIALERCACVMLPLRATSLISTRSTAVVLTSGVVVLQVGFLVVPLEADVALIDENETEREWHLVPTTTAEKSQLVSEAVVFSLLNISLPILTFVVVSLATALTVTRLQTAIKWRQTSSSSTCDNGRRQVALTKMLVLVSCMYIVTMVPVVTIIVCRLLVVDFSPYGHHHTLYLTCSTLADQLPLVNCAFNFVVYCTQSSRYRAYLRQLLSCLLKNGNQFPVFSITNSLTCLY
ncbi:uncharacterized protein LOC112566168 [Pomacea canaliculata]|uniref:uncharacterized protein LOC112566168 n=1 Tax=Pomacea canaliculata TaxID=400727 RepID=UPI000D735285|nr:uncharacterized protein LOC112566168 [Pomacea canaliculata]